MTSYFWLQSTPRTYDIPQDVAFVQKPLEYWSYITLKLKECIALFGRNECTPSCFSAVHMQYKVYLLANYCFIIISLPWSGTKRCWCSHSLTHLTLCRTSNRIYIAFAVSVVINDCTYKYVNVGKNVASKHVHYSMSESLDRQASDF